jgi:protein-S-isoprenylcysteine O-methyltransferase Ste14
VNTPAVPDEKSPDQAGIPRWLAAAVGLVIWLVGMPLVHGGLPWLLSRFGPRYGWADGRPGAWNLLGLIPIAAGVAGLGWILGTALARIGDLPDRMRLDLTSPYLLTSGPYAFSRNPMSVADVVLWLGWAGFYGSVVVLLGLLALSPLGLIVVPREERGLEARFGEAYRQYRRTVPRWLGKRRR